MILPGKKLGKKYYFVPAKPQFAVYKVMKKIEIIIQKRVDFE